MITTAWHLGCNLDDIADALKSHIHISCGKSGEIRNLSSHHNGLVNI